MNTKMNVVYKLIGIITSTIKRILQTLKPKHYMSNDLKTRIEQFNKIKFANDDSKRIIIGRLTVNSGKKWSVEDKTVTQGCKDKE